MGAPRRHGSKVGAKGARSGRLSGRERAAVVEQVLGAAQPRRRRDEPTREPPASDDPDEDDDDRRPSRRALDGDEDDGLGFSEMEGDDEEISDSDDDDDDDSAHDGGGGARRYDDEQSIGSSVDPDELQDLSAMLSDDEGAARTSMLSAVGLKDKGGRPRRQRRRTERKMLGSRPARSGPFRHLTYGPPPCNIRRLPWCSPRCSWRTGTARRC